LLRDSRANEQDDRGGTDVRTGELAERGGVDVLLRGGGTGDCGAGSRGCDAGGNEVLGERLEVPAGHVDDECGVVWEGSGPAGRQGKLAGGMVRCGKDELRRTSAIGERSLQRGGDCEGGGDAGDDLEGDLMLAEEGDLLSGATEDKRVAGLEPDDRAFIACVFEEELMDPGLCDPRLAAALADGDDERGGASEGQDLVGDEVVWEDDVSGLEQVCGAQGEESGVAGACSDEVDATWFCVWDRDHAFSAGMGLVRACSRASRREGH